MRHDFTDPTGFFDLKPGDYGKGPDGRWWTRPPVPAGMRPVPANRLGTHTVVEHPDHTITVSPSILNQYGDGRRWHGYLRAGQWQALGDCVYEPLPPEETNTGDI